MKSTIPHFTIRECIEAGVHFGHRTRRWNPRMAPYIFGVKDGIHILDLQQTAVFLHTALQNVIDIVAKNGRVLFVGTKRQASEHIAEAAKRCGQYYVNHRWLGGMLTNWDTISVSIKVMKELEDRLQNKTEGLTKKEMLDLTRRYEKLERALGGIKDMGGLPDLVFVLDTNIEHLAISESRKLKIPIIAITDSNSDPSGLDYIVPGNDDATRAIKFYCKLMSDAVLAGIQQEMTRSGADIGSIEDVGSLMDSSNSEKTSGEKPKVSIGTHGKNRTLTREKPEAKDKKEETIAPEGHPKGE